MRNIQIFAKLFFDELQMMDVEELEAERKVFLRRVKRNPNNSATSIRAVNEAFKIAQEYRNVKNEE